MGNGDHQVFLLRHGQTEWSESGRHTGRSDIALTDAGKRKAAAAGSILAALRAGRGAARVLASPRQRSRNTAELAGLTVDKVTEGLAEWDYGDYEGITTDEVRRTVPGWTVWSHPVPGGESAQEVTDRADALLHEVRGSLERSDVILVGHGHFSRVLVSRWLGLPASSGVHFGIDPASVSVLGAERGEPQLVRLNITPAGD